MVHSVPLLLLLSTARADDLGVLPHVVAAPLQALWPPPPPPPPPPPAPVLPGRLDVTIHPMGAEARIRLHLDLQVLDAGPVVLPVVGADLALSEARLDGSPVALPPDPDGWRRLAASLSASRHDLEVVGVVPTPRPSLDLPISRASRTHVRIDDDLALTSPDGVPTTPSALDLRPTDRLRLSWHEPHPPSPRPAVVQASAVTALSVDESGVLARSRIRYRLRHQPADTLRINLPAVDDLQVEGAAVRAWEVQGGTVVVHLVEPMIGAVVVELSWRAEAPGPEGGTVALPRPQTTSGRLETGQVSVQAGDQGTPVVQPGAGLVAIPASQVAAWGRGLVPGTPLLSLAITGPSPSLRVRVLDLTPAEAPATVVDSADIQVAYAAHGRALLRCRYQVRNDRNQYLGMRLPEHSHLLGVRVAGRVVQAVVDSRDGGQRLTIPLEKSVETLRGLVSFPVEVMLLVDEEPWQPRGRRQVQAPALDAPVASARWELVLPPGTTVREIAGNAQVEATRGTPRGTLVYGRASAVVADAEPPVEEWRREQSLETWNRAYRAYQDNDFERARELLDESLQLDADNRAARDLAENVDLLLGSGEVEGAEVQGRRIRALARARTGALATEQAKLEEALEEAERAGDTAALESLLDRYAAVTRTLARVEDEEAVDQKTKLQVAEKKLETLSPARPSPAASPKASAVAPPRTRDDAGDEVGLGAAGTGVGGGGVGGGGVGGGGAGFDGEAIQGIGGGFGYPDDGIVGGIVDGIVGGIVDGIVGGDIADSGSLDGAERDDDQLDGARRDFGSIDEVLFDAEGVGADLPAPDEPEPVAPPAASTSAHAAATGTGGAPSAGRPPTVPDALAMDPAVTAAPRHTAAPLITAIPEAGPHLVLTRQLLAPDQPLTVTLTYRLAD